MTAHQAQVGADEPGSGSERDQTRGALAPRLGRLGIGEGHIGRQLGLVIGGLGPFREAGRAWTIPARLGGQEVQVRTRRAPRWRLHVGVPSAKKRSMKPERSTTLGLGLDPAPMGEGPQARRGPEQGARPGPARRLDGGHQGPGEGCPRLGAPGHPGPQALGHLAR